MSMVLVVDDKEMMRDSVGSTLQRAGFTVVTSPDGAAALEVIARRRPDAVVTDMKMPGLTGQTLIKPSNVVSPDTVIFSGCFPSAVPAGTTKLIWLGPT